MNIPTLDQITQAIGTKGYNYLNDGNLYHLNIIGIRSSDPTPNTFDDLLTVLFHDETGQRYIYMACTTKPGLYYLQHPDNLNGVAILVPGQYTNLFVKGLHKGQYPCLVQSGNLQVYRDNNMDGTFDYTRQFAAPPSCGIEIHHANNNFASTQVDNWSAGCQVVADPASFTKLMELVDKSIAIRGNHFTYTLIDEADLSAGATA